MPEDSHKMELLSRQVSQAHRAAVQAELNAAGLAEVGHPLLMSILECSGGEDSFAQRELAQLLHISPAAVANSLKSLERGGYIRREPGPDARCNRVFLTEKGCAAVEGCRAVFQKISQTMLTGFSPEEQAQLLEFQCRMLHNLSGYVQS